MLLHNIDCAYACYNSPPQKEVKRLENEVMVLQQLNSLSTRFLCNARVKHMHKLLKQLVAEISVMYTDERYRKYTCYSSIKGL